MSSQTDSDIGDQLRRIADALEQIVSLVIPKLVETYDAKRAIESAKFIDTADVDARCKQALRREQIVDVEEITRERFKYTRCCGDKTIERLIAFRDRMTRT